MVAEVIPDAMGMEGIIWLGAACGIISYIVSEAAVFLWLRKWVYSKSKFFGKLISCGLCFGTWFSFILTALYQPNLFNKIPVLDEILTSFVISGISAFIWISLCLLIKKADK